MRSLKPLLENSNIVFVPSHALQMIFYKNIILRGFRDEKNAIVLGFVK